MRKRIAFPSLTLTGSQRRSQLAADGGGRSPANQRAAPRSKTGPASPGNASFTGTTRVAYQRQVRHRRGHPLRPMESRDRDVIRSRNKRDVIRPKGPSTSRSTLSTTIYGLLSFSSRPLQKKGVAASRFNKQSVPAVPKERVHWCLLKLQRSDKYKRSIRS